MEKGDFIVFVIRDFIEATIRYNYLKRGLLISKMKGYIDDWFSLLGKFDTHNNGIVFYYDELMKIASPESLNLVLGHQSVSLGRRHPSPVVLLVVKLPAQVLTSVDPVDEPLCPLACVAGDEVHPEVFERDLAF